MGFNEKQGAPLVSASYCLGWDGMVWEAVSAPREVLLSSTPL